MIAGRVYEKAWENLIETSTQVLFYLMLKMRMSISEKKKKKDPTTRNICFGISTQVVKMFQNMAFICSSPTLVIPICQGRYSLNIQWLV